MVDFSYFELKEILKTVIPRRGRLADPSGKGGLIKEKGRKRNYRQKDLETGELKTIQRLLNKDEISSFLEISLKAADCPMPLNCDLWDGLKCPYGCRYCYADNFHASLYTAFFDNARELGIRFCNPEYFKAELDKLMKFRGKEFTGSNALQKAISIEIPIRLGIRFEDFSPIELKKGVSLQFLKYMAEQEYPVMINTKSDLLGLNDNYLRALADNKAKAAVHITMLSSNEPLNKVLEPGAPSFKKRVESAKVLLASGVRVVARVEPLMIFINDEESSVDQWIEAVYGAGVRNVTLDSYSWSAKSVQSQMELVNFDFNRMFSLMSDSQGLGSLILSKFMDFLRSRGFKCSSFDFGNVPSNDQDICCEVGDWYPTAGFSYGNIGSAIRLIVSKGGSPVTWDMFDEFVNSKGGWLSDQLRKIVFERWCLIGNESYFPSWAPGVEACGVDAIGRQVWRYIKEEDFRLEILEGVL